MLKRLLLTLTILALLGAKPVEPSLKRLDLFFLGRPVGSEVIRLRSEATGNSLEATFAYTERGSEVRADGLVETAPDFSVKRLSVHGRSYRPFIVDTTMNVDGSRATIIDQDHHQRDVAVPRTYVAVAGYNPLSVQMMALRYWLSHGRPARLPQLPGGDDLRIREAGKDVVGNVELTRYTLSNVVWGNETIWLDPDKWIAAASTYAGNLPLEAVAPEYRDALPALRASATADRIAEMSAWGRDLRPVAEGRFAIVGVRLIDGTGAPPVENAAVVVANGRIVDVGPHVSIPRGIPVIDGRGKTLLPGLWEMHAHFAQVDYGPAYLAAGVTTARDLGDETEFVTAVRDLIGSGRGLGPKLLLACLVDGSGEKSFGTTYADTPEQGRQVVRRCKSRGYVQMKIYDYIQPDVLRAIAAEAHALGMTVTGHVPRAMTAELAVLAGMDQINHPGGPLEMAKAGDAVPLTPESPGLKRAVAFFKAHGTVIDPTQAWGELLSRPRNVPIESFEPGFAKAPYTLRSVIGSSGSPPSAEARWGMSPDAALLIRSLDAAGVPIVAGTDKALPAHSLLRELELYAKAGIPPLEVIRLATSGSAKVMGLDQDVGTVARGKRADLVLVDGDPSRDIAALRNVYRVVTVGRMYDPAPLWRSVGFRP